MIIKSNTKEDNADIVIVTTKTDIEGSIIIGAVKPSGNGEIDGKIEEANILLSIYGKDKLQNYITRAYEENRIIKTNPKKAVIPVVQFCRDMLLQDYSNNLAQYKKIVNNMIGKMLSNLDKKR